MSKFEIKDKLDNILYNTYNLACNILYIFDFKTKNILKQNLEFKNIHLGQRCFILGTGPSLSHLTGINIENLNKEIVFGVNSLYKSKVGSEITPQYYALMDNLYWGEWSETFSEIRKKYPGKPPIFITDTRALDTVNLVAENSSTIYIHSKKYPTNKMSADIDKNIYAAMNVISYSILSAIYMGFREIYLLGCDYSAFCTSGKGHCYDDEAEVGQINYNLAFYLKFYWITTEFHYLIAKLAKRMNVSVINLTPNSLLDAYQMDSIEKVLKQEVRS